MTNRNSAGKNWFFVQKNMFKYNEFILVYFGVSVFSTTYKYNSSKSNEIELVIQIY